MVVINYQNLPRKGSVLKSIIAPPGFTYFFFDYSQLEIRIAAWYMKDALWISAYKNGEDVHEQTLRIIYGRPGENKEERVLAKGFNFAMAYGAGWRRIATMLKVIHGGAIEEHKERSQEMLTLFYRAHPALKNFKYAVGDRMMSDQERTEYFVGRLGRYSVPPRKVAYRGHLQNRFGRRYKMPSIIQYKALEWVTSGDAGGDMHLRKFVELSEFFEQRHLQGGVCALIHDAYVCLVENASYQNTIAQEIKLMLEDEPEITAILPLKVDVEQGKNWLEKKPWEYDA